MVISTTQRIMLDTNAASAIIKGPTAEFRERLLSTPIALVCISAVTEGELRFGLAKRPQATRLAEAVEAFLVRTDILPWDSVVAQRYGSLRASLARDGAPLGNLDTVIAAHALAIGAALVTGDKTFLRVVGLRVMDWSA